MLKELVGISLLGIVADILLSNSSYKKYIGIVIGLIFISIIISFFSGFDNIYENIFEIDNIIETNYNEINNQFNDIMIENTKEDIVKTLLESQIKASRVDIPNSNGYVNYVEVYVNDINNKEKIVEIISNKYKLDKNMIKVRESVR